MSNNWQHLSIKSKVENKTLLPKSYDKLFRIHGYSMNIMSKLNTKLPKISSIFKL